MPTFATPADVVRQIGRCRSVVTGSYHAGVFALSQGIPIVAVTKSSYYDQKFAGLADQFGAGCHVVDLRVPGWPERLRSLVVAAHADADATRDQLLDAASHQVEQGRAAYARLAPLVRGG